MNTLQMNAAKALAKGWIKKQEAFLQTVPVALRDEVRRQLGCVDINQVDVDTMSKQILEGKYDTERNRQAMMKQMIDGADEVGYDAEDGTLEVDMPIINQSLANLLGVTDRQFFKATISFKDSTLKLTRLLRSGDIANFEEELLAVGMPEAKLLEVLQAAEEDEDKETEMYEIYYTVPLLIVFGTRVTSGFSPF